MHTVGNALSVAQIVLEFVRCGQVEKTQSGLVEALQQSSKTLFSGVNSYKTSLV